FYDLEAEIGQFPERNKPLSVYVDIDTEHGFPSYEVLNQQILGYKLAIFNPSAYLKVEQQAKYHATLGKQREHNLVGMMQVNFLKRLESSIASFTLSLKRTIAKIADIEHKIIAFQGGQALPDSQAEPDLQNQAKLDLLLDDELDEDWVGQKLKFNLADLELDNWLFDLRQDQLALKTLLKNALTITPERDAKLHKLKCLISEKIAQPINADNKKIIIFTAFADTAIYLHEHLSAWYASEFNLHCALICGNSTKTSYGKNDYNSILTHFSPRAKQRTGIETAEIDLLIATDCISEGQNLQDCDYLINYDIHWNPVRIIQRFGRIDRLGSQNTCIQLVNFWPTKELDNYINLKARVEARMALVDASATGEDNLLTIEEEIDSELKYRHQQLEKLKHEVLDLEDMDESLSLTDFNLADFKHELLNQFDNQRQQLLNAPLGLYALVSAQNGMPSGVIFCLRQTAQHDNNQKINPLTPYFLVYIGDNGTVHYHYSHVKQILEIFKTLCDDKEHACETLCQLFNQQTQNGADMSHYSELLNLAVAELVTVVKNKGQQSVLSGRGGVLMPEKKQVNSLADFELITWLIIHGGQALPDS
ncbi:MAG: C-terminal helicase domain-containing protein, partial [Methylococcales bacterium]|nr:C-terminal helicase domain-containing protein [Methylococcales bacterium]